MAKARRAGKKAKAEEICGRTPDQIRRAYFEGKLDDLFAVILADSRVSERDVAALGGVLEKLRAEEIIFKQRLGAHTSIDLGVQAPPTVEELKAGGSDAEWRDKAQKASKYVESKLDEMRDVVANRRKVPMTYWVDAATIFVSYLGVIDRNMAWLDQLYRARMTETIQRRRCSRKEAEEFARLTREYGDYRNATLLRERIIEAIQICKKQDAKPI